jgi:hypothetical protein
VPERQYGSFTDPQGREVPFNMQLHHTGEPRQCSFCGKDEEAVFLLIDAGGASICDECVDVLHEGDDVTAGRAERSSSPSD